MFLSPSTPYNTHANKPDHPGCCWHNSGLLSQPFTPDSAFSLLLQKKKRKTRHDCNDEWFYYVRFYIYIPIPAFALQSCYCFDFLSGALACLTFLYTNPLGVDLFFSPSLLHTYFPWQGLKVWFVCWVLVLETRDLDFSPSFFTLLDTTILADRFVGLVLVFLFLMMDMICF